MKITRLIKRKTRDSFLGPLLYRLAISYHTGGKFFCPVCDNRVRKFGPTPWGNPPRQNAQCPICESLERHRLDWLFFKRKTDLFDELPKKILHVAPERKLAQLFRGLKDVDYLSGDLDGSKAMVQMDITEIQRDEDEFSVIYCSHVLEHVPNDRKALSELYRVLTPGGWAILNVPISTGRTYEDSSITDPNEREKEFGQWNHVRRCGLDYVERMETAGFAVEAIQAGDVVSEEECMQMAIGADRWIFVGKKAEIK